jgi:hypothetical protein
MQNVIPNFSIMSLPDVELGFQGLSETHAKNKKTWLFT